MLVVTILCWWSLCCVGNHCTVLVVTVYVVTVYVAPGKCACTVVTFAKWEWFSDWADTSQNKRGAEYENLKKQFGEQIWAQVLALYPQLKDKVGVDPHPG